jgi:hypothetical protein
LFLPSPPKLRKTVQKNNRLCCFKMRFIGRMSFDVVKLNPIDISVLMFNRHYFAPIIKKANPRLCLSSPLFVYVTSSLKRTVLLSLSSNYLNQNALPKQANESVLIIDQNRRLLCVFSLDKNRLQKSQHRVFLERLQPF